MYLRDLVDDHRCRVVAVLDGNLSNVSHCVRTRVSECARRVRSSVPETIVVNSSIDPRRDGRRDIAIDDDVTNRIVILVVEMVSLPRWHSSRPVCMVRTGGEGRRARTTIPRETDES